MRGKGRLECVSASHSVRKTQRLVRFFFFGQGVRGIRPVVSEEMTTGLLLGRPTSVYFVSSVVDNLYILTTEYTEDTDNEG